MFRDEDLGSHMRRLDLASQTTRPDLLTRLAYDTEPGIREAVARNPHVLEHTLIGLFRDPDPRVRATAALNGRMPAPLLMLLARDRDADVREAVARNPHTPAMSLAELTGDPEPRVREQAAAHPACPPAGRVAGIGSRLRVIRPARAPDQDRGR